jgi:hypothetical protein
VLHLPSYAKVLGIDMSDVIATTLKKIARAIGELDSGYRTPLNLAEYEWRTAFPHLEPEWLALRGLFRERVAAMGGTVSNDVCMLVALLITEAMFI